MTNVIRGQVKSSAVSVGTSATVLPATALTGRISITIQNNGANTVFVGHSTVTTTNGYPLAAGDSLGLDIGQDALIYGIVASATENVRVLEGA
tara:strand:+ start:1231 stop:1509 length:279 start_codon:yes stop_codon:yes gene_type:complete